MQQADHPQANVQNAERNMCVVEARAVAHHQQIDML
jgi:hypothetical protein